jgi:tetratricopeptide (TPR) repeat protein
MKPRVRALALAAFFGVLASAHAFAQELPDSVRAAGVTEVEWGQAQGVIRSQAAILNLREDAVRTLAIEIFEGQPNLSFEACLDLIRGGAERLPRLVATARALNPRGDATLADLQTRAVAAAEEGRLREALALQDEYAARFREALERVIEQPQLDLAASYAAAGDMAYSLGDYVGAASRYAEAAQVAPASAVEVRWQYRSRQAASLHERGFHFNETDALVEAARLYENEVLPLAPRETRPLDWARSQEGTGVVLMTLGERGLPDRSGQDALQSARDVFRAALEESTASRDPASYASIQNNLGWTLQMIGFRGDARAFRDAVAAHRAALAVLNRDADRTEWLRTQSRLGNALRLLGMRDANERALRDAQTAFEAALSVSSREANPSLWAATQSNLGLALVGLGRLGESGALERAVAAFEAALTISTRESDPVNWATVQVNLGTALIRIEEHNEAGVLDRAVAAFQAGLSVFTREADPANWANANYGLALAYRDMNRYGEARAAAEAALAGYEQVGNRHWSRRTRTLLARLPR